MKNNKVLTETWTATMGLSNIWRMLAVGSLVAGFCCAGISLYAAGEREPWVKEWKVLTTLVEYGESDLQLYYADPVRVGFGNPCSGRKGILYLHPPSPAEPARVERKFKVAGEAPGLAIGVCGNSNSDGDFILSVKIDGKPLTQERLIAGADGWQDLSFDLSGFLNREVTVTIEAKSNNWLYEYAFIDYVLLVDDIRKVKSVEAPQEKKPAVPGKVADRGDPNTDAKSTSGRIKAESMTSSAIKTVAATKGSSNKQESPQTKQPPTASQILFEDNFDGNNKGRGNLHYRGFNKWYVRGGEVDLIGNGFRDKYPGNGLYVDLNGTKYTSTAKVPGKLQSKQLIDLKDEEYVLEFDLGWQGGVPGGKVNIRLGTTYQKALLLDVRGSGDEFVKKKFLISVLKPEKGTLVFEYVGKSTDYVLLDNIRLIRASAKTN